jgi:hypothetical protein
VGVFSYGTDLRGNIFRVRIPYFGFMPLSLFFQKWWAYGKGYKKAYEKEDLVYWKGIIIIFRLF